MNLVEQDIMEKLSVSLCWLIWFQMMIYSNEIESLVDLCRRHILITIITGIDSHEVFFYKVEHWMYQKQHVSEVKWFLLQWYFILDIVHHCVCLSYLRPCSAHLAYIGTDRNLLSEPNARHIHRTTMDLLHVLSGRWLV